MWTYLLGFHVPENAATHPPALTRATVSYTDPQIARTLWKTPVATVVTRAEDGLILDANESFCRLLEYRRENLIGRRTTELGMWADPGARDQVTGEFPSGSSLTNLEFDLRTATGKARTVLSTIVKIDIDGRQCLIGQMYDLTERRQSEDRLRLLDRVARIGYESMSYTEILDSSLRAIHEFFPTVRVGYASLENKLLTIEGSSEPPGMLSIVGETIDLAAAPEYETALLSGEPIIAPDVRFDDRFREFGRSLLELGITAVLDVPVCRNSETVGVLFFEAPVPAEWTTHHCSALAEIAALLAVSLFRARAEEELRQERELIQTVMDYVPDFLYVKDVHSRFTRVNRAVAEFHGFDNPDDFIGKTDFDLFPEALAKQYMADEQKVIATGEPVINRLEPQDTEQTILTLTSTVPFRGADGAILGVVGTSRDVSEREAMQNALRASESRQRALLEAIPDAVYRIDRNGELLETRANKQIDLRVGLTSGQGATLSQAFPPAASRVIEAGIMHSLAAGNTTTVEYEIDQDDLIQTFEMRIAPCGEDQVLAIARDVTERKMLEKRLAHRATHDPLTGLPNRGLFAQRLNEALANARSDQSSVAVLFVDLDNFKYINDTLGHSAGDRMLSAISDSLRRSIRSADTVARIGGDEFAVLLEELPRGDEAQLIATRIAEQIARPIRIGRTPVSTTASIGIAFGFPDRDSAESLLDEADHAMYEAKRIGKRGTPGVIRFGGLPNPGKSPSHGENDIGSDGSDEEAANGLLSSVAPQDLYQTPGGYPSNTLRYLRPKIS